MTPELTVVIPTRNRQGTAVKAARLGSEAGSPREVDVVMQDCSDDSSLGMLLRGAGLGQRVRYFHVAERLSMTDNWNRGMEHASGEYTIFVGDDDAVTGKILSVVRWARREGLDAVKGQQYTAYSFPDVGDRALAATLRIPPFTGATSVVPTAPVLRRVARTGNGYSDLPMVYHNVVRTSVLRRIAAKTGKTFDGLAPDIYSGIVIACEIDRFGLVDYPLTIVGASAASNSNRETLGLGHLHVAEYNGFSASWLTPDSVKLVASVPDNLARAFQSLGRQDLLERLDIPRIFARTIVAEPSRMAAHVRKYLRVQHRRGRSVAGAVGQLLIYVVIKVGLNVVRPSRRATGETTGGVASLTEAVEVQDRWLRAHGIEPPGPRAE